MLLPIEPVNHREHRIPAGDRMRGPRAHILDGAHETVILADQHDSLEGGVVGQLILRLVREGVDLGPDRNATAVLREEDSHVVQVEAEDPVAPGGDVEVPPVRRVHLDVADRGTLLPQDHIAGVRRASGRGVGRPDDEGAGRDHGEGTEKAGEARTQTLRTHCVLLLRPRERARKARSCV